ncbi:uncharacterized protein TNCV_1300271 [Trichonephila clavipes]|nr:uncharacterized protein TNCV_1300271 [Trichonephila clavipes]
MHAILLEIPLSPLNAIHKWQLNSLNHQTDVQICNQGVWNNHERAPDIMRNSCLDHNSKCRSRPQTSWLQILTWPPNQQMAITGTKAKLTLIKKHNMSPLQPTMSISFIPLTSQTTDMFGIGRMHDTGQLSRSCPCSNLFVKVCYVNCCSNFSYKRSSMSQNHLPNWVIYLFNSVT